MNIRDGHDPASMGHVLLRGHGTDQSSVYQQGSGNQFNIQHTALPSVVIQQSSLLAAVDYWPLVREVDPLDVGVHRASIEKGNAVPAYVMRDADREIRQRVSQALDDGGFVLIVGDSTAGKSRAAYECLASIAPNRRLLHPEDGTALRASYAALLARAKECVLWLDNLELYLADDTFTHTVVMHLSAAGVAVVATMRAEQYRRFLQEYGTGHGHAHAQSTARFHRLLARTQPILLKRLWSSSEIERAAVSDDSRVLNALSNANKYGIAEYLAAGPRLLEEYKLAAEGVGNPRGGALVSAAVDCARAGIDGYINLELLESLHQIYLTRMGGDLLEPEHFEAALAWATKRRYGATSLLIRSESRFRAFDYITDSVMRDATAEPPPPELWQAVLESTRSSPASLASIASAAFKNNEMDVARTSWRVLAEGDSAYAGDSAVWLGVLAESQTKADEDQAVYWYSRAIELNESEGNTRLGLILQRRGELDRAEAELRSAAERGNAHGALHLGQLLQDNGHSVEAEKWLRRAALGDEARHFALTDFAVILETAGQVEEAETVYTKAAEWGVSGAKNSLALLALKTSGAAAARKIWLEAVEEGDPRAAKNLAKFHQERGEYSEAEWWLSEAARLGSSSGNTTLANILVEQQKVGEAETVLRLDAEDGQPFAVLRLAEFLLDSNELEEAEALARAAHSMKVAGAASRIAAVLEKAGQTSELMHWWKLAAQEGDRVSKYRLASGLAEEGQFLEAEGLLVELAETGTVVAACELGGILANSKRFPEAERWYQLSADGGHDHAACRHGQLLLKLGSVIRAEERLRYAFDRGHLHLRDQLAQALVRQGKGKAAAELLRGPRKTSRARPSRGRKPKGGRKA